MSHNIFSLGVKNLEANEHKNAVSHFILATKQGHPEATYNLGLCYELGTGVDKDSSKAMECYKKAAKLGHNKAMYNLAIGYARGIGGLKQDRSAALSLLKDAEKLGLPEAKMALKTRKPSHARKHDDEVFLKPNESVASQLSTMKFNIPIQ